MTKFSCTMSSGSLLHYATIIAENAREAREMAVAETNKQLAGRGGRWREWSTAVLEAEVEGPARTLECGHRDN